MLGRKLVRRVGMAVTSAALLAGTLGVVGVTASSAQSTAFFVAAAGDGGVNTGNCTLAAKPCATIGYALQQEALVAPNSTGSVINLAKGTYDSSGAGDFFNVLTAANSGVTILGHTNGKGTDQSTVSPQTCAQLAATTSGLAMIAFNPGDNGITVENIDLDGAAIAACPGYQAGVIITGTGAPGGGTTGDAIVGDVIQSGAFYGILTNNNADSTIISNTLAPVLCTTVVTGPNTGLNAGWTTPANLKVKALPKCEKFIESGHGAATGVFIDGVAYCMTTSASKNILVLTGTPDPATGCSTGGDPIINSHGTQVGTGDTVIYNTSVAPFLQFGIACNGPFTPEDQTTDCAISDNTVSGGGTVYNDFPAFGDYPPAGILATGGATADVDGNTVSNVFDNEVNPATPDASTAQDGIGIALIPDGVDGCTAGNSEVGVNDLNNPNTGHGNKLSGNDVGIAVSGNGAPACTDANPSFELNNNTVSSGIEAGIALTSLGQAFGGELDSPMESNSVSGVAKGVGIEAEGINEVSIGGPLASEGNTVTGNGLGLVLAPDKSVPPAPGVGSIDNLIQNNTFTGNIAYGVLTVGSYQVNELVTQIPTVVNAVLNSADNTFNSNNWGTATSATNGTFPSEINGAEILDGTGWGGGCNSELGDCTNAQPNSLTFEGPNTTFSSTSPGSATITLSVCNGNSASEDLPRGTEITFNTPNNVLNPTPGEVNDGGTFYVTADAIITGNVGCTGAFYNLSVQAIAPAEVGTLGVPTGPTGQPYILGQGDLVFVNANGNLPAVTAKNFYGTGANSNSCTPADVTQTAGNSTGTLITPHGAVTTPDVFGATDPPSLQYSTTLQASTGGVNATYAAC
jgi:hypothetical protein